MTQTFTRDELGRITKKDTATYTWDTLKNGLLTSETDQGITRTYAYNNALQLSQLSVTVDSITRTIKHQYDSKLGRPKALEYPNGLTLKYSYNKQGYLSKTSNANSNYIYREVTAIDAQGHITGAKLANDLMSQSSSFNESSGTMSSTSISQGLSQLHGHIYSEYDEYLNIKAETNALTGLAKTYNYDNLNRLTTYTASNTSPVFSLSVNYTHDAVGNLLKKTDYSANKDTAYQYCTGTNALCILEKASGQIVNFTYDGRGNLINSDGLTLTYNALNKPLTITGRNATTQFTYGSDNARAKQTRTISGQISTTYYVDKLFEMDNDGSWRAYFDDIAVLSWTPEQKHKLLYTLRDRLGSATTLVNHDGQITSRRYFDPFGRTSSDTGNSQLTDLSITNRYRRGFTDHEHLNEQQLIHMNGRIYDYNVGRFMSVDPFIQAPSSTQSINPYSYIMNNPLAGTDPTGYMGKCDQNPTCQMQSFFSSVGSGGSSLIGNLTGRLKTTLSNGHDTKQETQKGETAAEVKSPAAVSYVLDRAANKNTEESARATADVDWTVDNPKLANTKQSKLTPEERKKRLAGISKVKLNGSQLPAYLRAGSLAKARTWLKSFALTDQGYELLSGYTGDPIMVVLVKGLGSGMLRKGRIQLDIDGEGYAQAAGRNTYVEIKGMRLLSHELVHGLTANHRSDSVRWQELEAVRLTNMIMKQHSPELAGERTIYGGGISYRELPVIRTIKE